MEYLKAKGALKNEGLEDESRECSDVSMWQCVNMKDVRKLRRPFQENIGSLCGMISRQKDTCPKPVQHQDSVEYDRMQRSSIWKNKQMSTTQEPDLTITYWKYPKKNEVLSINIVLQLFLLASTPIPVYCIAASPSWCWRWYMPRYQTRLRTVAPAAEQLADHLTKGSHDIHDANHRVLYVIYINRIETKFTVLCRWTPSKLSLSPKHATSPQTEKVPHPKSLFLPHKWYFTCPISFLYLPQAWILQMRLQLQADKYTDSMIHYITAFKNKGLPKARVGISNHPASNGKAFLMHPCNRLLKQMQHNDPSSHVR